MRVASYELRVTSYELRVASSVIRFPPFVANTVIL